MAARWPVVEARTVMSFKFLLVLFVILAAGVLLYWSRTRSDRETSGPRGRVRGSRVAWASAFAVLTAGLLLTARLQSTHQNGRGLMWLVFTVAVALLLALQPRLAERVVPVVLILLGLAGFLLALNQLATNVLDFLQSAPATAVPGAGGGSTAVGAASWGPGWGAAELVLLLSYAFVLLGGWLTWRSQDPVLSRARLLLGRVNDLPLRAQYRALLLLPVAIMAADVVDSPNWSWDTAGPAALWLALVLGAAVAVLRRWPLAAARLAAACLLALGLAGFVLAHQWGPHDYGAVVVLNPNGPGPGWAVGEAVVLLAFGAWLVPQSFPSVGGLLGLAPEVELTRRVQRLTESRAVAVDTAASDLRRLERDLHDGAQARLVALGMSLRAAERLIPMNPDAAVALVAEARETSARALTELRELVRGVHPPVLADRGLADAVRALALDCPLAVETRIDLPGRPPGPVETACYFAVAELLTNAAKHSGAREARIDVSYSDGLLRIEVTDFGLGGADPTAGSGLAGVEKRLAAFDGIMATSSPPGGPTIVVLEVPCALSSPKTSTC
jgi:signal transduction histidine kinase